MAAKRRIRRKDKTRDLTAVKVNVGVSMRYRKRLQASNVTYKKQTDKAAATILKQIAKLDRSDPGAFQKQVTRLQSRVVALEKNLAAANKRSVKAVDTFIKELRREQQRRLTNSVSKLISPEAQKSLLAARKATLDKRVTKLRKKYVQSITEANQDYSTRVQTVLFEKLANPAINARKKITKAKGIVTRRIKNTVHNQAHELNSTLNKGGQQALGIKHYRWRNKKDGRVRPTHKHVNVDEKIFRWDTPPVETGGLHPGEDFNCRCIAVPVLVNDARA